MPQFKLFYTIHGGGDGTVRICFHEDREAAQLASDLEALDSTPYSDNKVHTADLEIDASGRLLNPQKTKKELRQKLAEVCGEGVKEETSPSVQFEKAAQPSAPKGAGFDISGKTIAFTGKFSTMTRAEAEARAAGQGAHVAQTVSRVTDFIVVGKNPGAKLRKALQLGVLIISEEEWAQKIPAAPIPKKPPAGPSL